MGAVKKRRRIWRLADGAFVDEAAIEAMVYEIEAGSGPDVGPGEPVPWSAPPPHIRRRPGGPRLSHAQSGPAPRLSLRLPSEVYAAALARARAEQRTVSQLAREALERYLRAD
jgi:hypothetical protein